MKERVLVYEFISGGGLAASDAATASPRADLLAQGTAMRDALLADLQALADVEVCCVSAPFAPLPPALSRVRVLAPPARVDPACFLAREAERHDRVWVVAPESDGLLATLAAAVGAERWIGCALPAIRLASSKASTRALLATQGIAVPAAWRPGEAEPPVGARWVVKPDDGAGCVETRLHEGFPGARDDLLARLARGIPGTLERWVDGTPLSLSLLCADGRAELLAINRQRVAARADGVVAYHGVDVGVVALDSPEGRQLVELAKHVAALVPGLAGYVGIDLVWSAAGPVVIEINPRLTCAYAGLSAALGRKLAGEILRIHHPEAAVHDVH